MNEKESFIIEDLDDYHLVIKADEEYRVRQELDAEVCFLSHRAHYNTFAKLRSSMQLEKNTYSLEA